MAVGDPLPPERRAAIEALLHDTDLSLRAIARQAGVSPDTVARLNREGAIRARRDVAADIASALSLDELAALLRAHVARQIATFDAALRGRRRARIDSARVLRDLGGLRRLLAQLAEDAAERDGHRTGNGAADGEPLQDLSALREDLARRAEAFGRERAAPPVPGTLPGEDARRAGG